MGGWRRRCAKPPKIVRDLVIKRRRSALLVCDHLQATDFSLGEQLVRLVDELLSGFAVQMGFAGGFVFERVEHPIDPRFTFDLRGVPGQGSRLAFNQRRLLSE